MARSTFTGPDEFDSRLGAFARDCIKQIVMAGADACVEETWKDIEQYRHVVTGSMMASVAPGRYHEDLGSGSVEVYPQGNDSRGISNATKAFVINYGRGGRRTAKTGDKFITGHKSTMQEVVAGAMQAKSDELIQQLNGGN